MRGLLYLGLDLENLSAGAPYFQLLALYLREIINLS